MVEARADLDMRHHIQIPLHRHHTAGRRLTGLELMINHIVEIIVVAVILAIGGELGCRGRSAIEIERHFRTY